MTTAIAIVGFRNPGDVIPCLDALTQSTAATFSIHICENGGIEAAVALGRALAEAGYPADTAESGAPAAPSPSSNAVWQGHLPGGQMVRILCPGRNLGYAGGVNTALDDANAMTAWQTLWILNPDTRPAPDALAEMRTYLASGKYGIVGCRLILRQSGKVQLYGGRWRALMARGYNIGLGAPAEATPDTAAIEREMTYVNGASMLVSRAYVETVGPMDERYFLYNEEVDWCFRRGPFRLGYAHKAVVVHDHGSTIGSNISRRRRSRLSVYLDERNKLLFTRRFFPRLYPLTALATFVLTAQYLRHGAWRNYGIALSGWLAGLRGLEGVPPFVSAPPDQGDSGQASVEVRSSA